GPPPPHRSTRPGSARAAMRSPDRRAAARPAPRARWDRNAARRRGGARSPGPGGGVRRPPPSPASSRSPPPRGWAPEPARPAHGTAWLLLRGQPHLQKVDAVLVFFPARAGLLDPVGDAARRLGVSRVARRRRGEAELAERDVELRHDRLRLRAAAFLELRQHLLGGLADRLRRQIAHR